MTTAIAQHQDISAKRAPLPPVEKDTPVVATGDDGGETANEPANEQAPTIASPPVHEAAQAPATATPATAKQPEQGNWFHRNRWFTKEPITYTGYQFFRSTMATIPYGFAMALGHHVFGLASVWGQKAGLTEKGIDTFTNAVAARKGGLPAVEAAANAAHEVSEFYKTGTKAMIGRNVVRVANSPLNAAVQIGMGFTLFRFTGGLVKNLRDRVMNEKNTPEKTDEETKNWFQTIKQTMRINWPAESTGTPIAALVLGYMSAVFAPNPESIAVRDAVKHPGFKGFGKQVKELWFNPKAKLLQNGAIWTMSYSLFFLLSESLFKDVQLRRVLWKCHPNSLKNGPDDVVGGPGAISYKTPEKDIAIPQDKGEKPAAASSTISLSAEEGYKQVEKQDDDKAKDSQHALRFPFFTAEPSVGRFIIRRVLPVSIGITAYAALKRAGYLAATPLGKEGSLLREITGSSGMMNQLTVKRFDELKTVGDHAKLYAQNAWREGKATAMFGALWMATDAWGTWYDKFVHKLQQPENAVPLNEHQQKKHEELLDRVNAKEQGAGRAA